MNTLQKVRKAPSNKSMGIEIEGILGSLTQMAGEWHGFFYKGYDGSIRTDTWRSEGVEFVSQPLTYEWLDKEIAKLYRKMPEFTVNHSCGIHVHVSKKWLSDKKAHEIWDVLKDESDDSLEEVFGRGRNSYTDEKIGDRYCLINTQNKATNEFRMFASGDAHWARYCLACAKFMVDHSRHLSMDMLRSFKEFYNYSRKS